METISTLPPYEARSFALWVARMTEEYFKNPDVQRRFEEWRKEQMQCQEKKEISED